ncbi:MAG: glycosyltransferase family 2 protein [Acaryochloris sp. RU_4_1]|nr:glycosyltransferase family 2 protein [Acaryochloris sp. RU_4_1]NJR55782.1 glycosyltransferase family 2 protein [Acaryochloris sp. CRU_2_0]
MIALAPICPELSIIIPTLYEGDHILNLLDHLTTLAEDIPYEVIVVDGDPKGSTLQYLPTEVHGILAHLGRGSQMNAGARLAQAPVLLFLHADARLPQHAFTQIQTALKLAPAGAFDLEINSSRLTLQWMSRIASWRSRLTRIPYGDQAIFIERATFIALGGFPNIPIMEDVVLMQKLKQHKIPICILGDRVLVSARRWEQEGILACTLRNWTILGLYYLGVKPHQLHKWYRPSPNPKQEGN